MFIKKSKLEENNNNTQQQRKNNFFAARKDVPQAISQKKTTQYDEEVQAMKFICYLYS